jgi:hypothetical protein
MSKQDQRLFAEIYFCLEEHVYKFLPVVPTDLRGCVFDESVQVFFGPQRNRREIAVTVFSGRNGYYSEAWAALVNRLRWVKQERQQQTAKH